VEDSSGIDGAGGSDEGGPGEGVDGQEGVSRGGSGQFGVGGGDEETAFVEAVELLAVERGYADADGGAAQGGIGQDGVDAVGEGIAGARRTGG
jgi:hypothetical protein